MKYRPVAVVGIIAILLILGITVDSRRRNVAEMTEIFQLQTRNQMICVTVCSRECLVGVLEDGVIDFREEEDGCLMACTDRLCPAAD